jgi:glycosyltransferase involved in cell wall biosynthesis
MARYKLLISAVSASPFRGSEPSIGWRVSRALADRHEVHVITSRRFRADLERANHEGLGSPDLHFHYIGDAWEWSPNKLKARIQNWRSYHTFLRQLRATAAELHARIRFDLVHHLTYATWRMPVPLDGLGMPFVYGPLGGAERFPPALLSLLGPDAIAFELVRYLSNGFSSRLGRAARCLRTADAVIASNPDAVRLFREIRGSEAGLHELLVTAFTSAERAVFGVPKPPRRDPQVLHAFASGSLEGRKGVALALEAIHRAKQQGLRICYRVGSSGPELAHLRKTVSRLGLEQEVCFGEPLPRAEYVRYLLESDIYLLPSLRDNAPSTLMEAMLAGCVPIVADCGGPAVIAAADCGYLVPVASRSGLVEGVAAALLELHAAPAKLATLGQLARERIISRFSIESYLATLESIYQSVLERRLSATR